MTAPTRVDLPARLDLSTAAALAETLKAHRGGDIVLDAGGVTHLGTPGLQVLLAARRSWADAGHSLALEGLVEGVAAQLAMLGLAPSDIATDPGDGTIPVADTAGLPGAAGEE
jgi:chemotaxis protein CheX